MNTKLIALAAALCMSTAAMAQTTQGQTSGTSNTNSTGTPTAGQSNTNSGEQNASGMQNNSNTQNTAPANNKASKNKMAKNGNKVDCNAAHTDGHATEPAHNRADCDNNTPNAKTQR